MRFSGSVKLRPVRVAFLIPADDLAVVRRVAQLNACVWGGRFNPIVPFPTTNVLRWTNSWCSQSKVDVARQYIDFFEPDVIVESSEGAAAELGWQRSDRILGLPRLLKLDEFFSLDNRGRLEFAAAIDILDVIANLHDGEYKFQHRQKMPFALVQPLEGNAFFDICLGAYPTDEVLAYIPRAYKDVFEPELLPPNVDTATKIAKREIVGPNWLTRHDIEEGLSGIQRDFTIFIFDPCDPGDAIEAWNYRLMNSNFFPVNVHWIANQIEMFREQIRAVHRPIPGNPFGTKFMSSLVFARSISEERARQLVQEHFSGLDKGTFAYGFSPTVRSPEPMEQHAQGKRILIASTSDSFDVEVSSDGYAKIPAPAPAFRNAAKTYHRSQWINVISPSQGFRDDTVATIYPTNLWNPDLQGMGLAQNLVVTREGWTLPERSDIGYSLVRPASGREAFIAWFKKQGIEATPSPEGQVALQVILAAGSLQACGMFADVDTINLLNEMAESHVDRSRGNAHVRATNPDRARSYNRVKQHFDNREKRGFGYWKKLEYFLKQSVFVAGLNIQCPTCGYQNWYGLDTASYSLTCARCLKTFRFGQSPQELKNTNWYYRVIGPFAAPNYASGGYAVALTLRCLADRECPLTWSTGLRLKELGDQEIDFAAWYRQRAFGGRDDSEPVLILGEAKSFGRNAIGDDVIESLRRVGERLSGAYLVVSSLKPIADYSQDELRRLRDLANWGRSRSAGSRPRNPLIVLTATELFSEFGISQAWKETGGLAEELATPAYVDFSNLDVLAEATQRLYLGLPSFHDDFSQRFIKSRASLVKLLQDRVRSISATDISADFSAE